MCDNVTAIANINNMGAIKSETCNNFAYRIWNFCTENKLWVSAAHIPDIYIYIYIYIYMYNIEADQQSRILQDATE